MRTIAYLSLALSVATLATTATVQSAQQSAGKPKPTPEDILRLLDELGEYSASREPTGDVLTAEEIYRQEEERSNWLASTTTENLREEVKRLEVKYAGALGALSGEQINSGRLRKKNEELQTENARLSGIVNAMGHEERLLVSLVEEAIEARSWTGRRKLELAPGVQERGLRAAQTLSANKRPWKMLYLSLGANLLLLLGLGISLFRSGRHGDEPKRDREIQDSSVTDSQGGSGAVLKAALLTASIAFVFVHFWTSYRLGRHDYLNLGAILGRFAASFLFVGLPVGFLVRWLRGKREQPLSLK